MLKKNKKEEMKRRWFDYTKGGEGIRKGSPGGLSQRMRLFCQVERDEVQAE